ncbi:MAG: transposase [Chloroflexi bacterium]|nr:transposase [Chloroflexota bacterium]
MRYARKLKAEPEDAEFRRVYSTRTSVERVFSRLKSHRSLNNITHRGLRKVTVHVFTRLIVQVAWALAMPERPRNLVRAA